ncbi:hypothetical protein [Massilia scottii]|uniref:hypothetical protein n=1 Tax=Massilia scottii TaxID=3057166 RepID=UPI002796B504|nr:hypothetical protein [Massilia sp. CCM 9029]MDQ1831650.1 hypothetical protein [Massilia sp. CCM 9029]
MLTMSNFAMRMLATLAAAHALAGCAAHGSSTNSRAAHPPDQEIPGTQRGAPGPGRGAMDMKAMCAMYRDMQHASTDQRPAMMDRQMKGMSPEMRRQHMEMMRQQCQ